MKRTFIAFKVPLPADFEQFYTELKHYFVNDPVNWVPLENLHVTLSFLGATPVGTENDVVALLRNLVSRFPAFNVQLKGLGAFPSEHRPKIFWYGLDMDQWVVQLQETLHVELLKLGFELDERNFNPHLTIGRVKGPLSKSFLVKKEEARKLKSKEMLIDEIIFFESILKGRTPVYEPIQKFPLATS